MCKEKALKCPCCNEELLVEIKNGEVFLVKLPSSDEKEINKLLKEFNIEFG